MTRAVARRREGLPALAVQAASPMLEAVIDQCTDPHPDGGRPERFPLAITLEAARLARDLSPIYQSVTLAHYEAWAYPLFARCANPPHQDDVPALIQLDYQALSAYPAGAFTRETQGEAMRAIKFAPTPADVEGIVGPVARRIWERMAALDHIAKAPTWEALLPTGEEKAAGLALVIGDVARALRSPDLFQEPVRSVEEQLEILRRAA